MRYDKEIKEFTKKCGSERRIRDWESKRPKKALSAYMIFVRETRAKVCLQYPEMHALEVMKKVGKLWQELDKENKKIFEDQAKVDKQRFLREMEKFQKELDAVNYDDEEPELDKNGRENDTQKVQKDTKSSKKLSSPSLNLSSGLKRDLKALEKGKKHYKP